MQYFSCIQLGEDYWVLRYSTATQCYDAQWNAYFPFAVAMLVCYPFGVPFVFFLILRTLWARGELGLEATKTRLGFLYDCYTAPFWWFEASKTLFCERLFLCSIVSPYCPLFPLPNQIFELLRKLFLSAIAVYIFSGSPTQILISQFIAFGANNAVLFYRCARARPRGEPWGSSAGPCFNAPVLLSNLI